MSMLGHFQQQQNTRIRSSYNYAGHMRTIHFVYKSYNRIEKHNALTSSRL